MRRSLKQLGHNGVKIPPERESVRGESPEFRGPARCKRSRGFRRIVRLIGPLSLGKRLLYRIHIYGLEYPQEFIRVPAMCWGEVLLFLVGFGRRRWSVWRWLHADEDLAEFLLEILVVDICLHLALGVGGSAGLPVE